MSLQNVVNCLQSLFRGTDPHLISVFLADPGFHGYRQLLEDLGYGKALAPTEADVALVPSNEGSWADFSQKYDIPIIICTPENTYISNNGPAKNLVEKKQGLNVVFQRKSLMRTGRELLKTIGQDTRSGTADTPERFAKAWEFWTSGYNADVSDVLTTFKDGADGCDEMVVVKGIWFYSHCEHHLAPFFGTVSIGYLPQAKIVGLSKLARITDIFARRLQVQERMTNQIATALMEHLSPLGCGVRVTARHLCMESRGIQKPGCETVTSSLQGKFRDDPTVRAEFLELVR